jgi:hypothetical protein
VPIYAALNLALARETALPRCWPQIDALLAQSGITPEPPLAAPLYEALCKKGLDEWNITALSPVWPDLVASMDLEANRR